MFLRDTFYEDLFYQANIYIQEKQLNKAKKLLKEITYAKNAEQELVKEAYMRLAYMELHYKGLINPSGAKKALEYVKRAIEHGATTEYAGATILMAYLFSQQFQQAADFLMSIEHPVSLEVIESSITTIFEEIAMELHSEEVHNYYIQPAFLPVLQAIHDQFQANEEVNIRIVEWAAEMDSKGQQFAYKVGQKMLENNPSNYHVYVALSKVCCYGYLNRSIELLEYVDKGIQMLEELLKTTADEHLKKIYRGEMAVLNSNKINAYMSLRQYGLAYELACQQFQSKFFLAEDFYNAAQALYQLKRFEEALEMIHAVIGYRQNRYLYKLLGDVLFSLKQFDRAARAYCRAIGFLQVKTNPLNARLFVNSSDEKEEAYYISLIECFYQLNNFVQAYVYLEECKKIYGATRETILWDTILQNSQLQKLENKKLKASIKKVNREMKKELNYAETQIDVFREWSLELLQLQGIEISDSVSFDELQEKMDIIITKMLNDTNDSSKYNMLFDTYEEEYSKLSPKSISFLATADFSYKENENHFIDFAPIVVEYAKVVEEELRLKLHQPTRTLGACIRFLTDKKVDPYYTKLDRLQELVAYRNNCAHPGRSTVETAKRVRSIVYELLPLFL